MAELEEVIGKIIDTHLGYEDHNIFSLNIQFDYGSSVQGTGHICICSKPSSDDDKYGVRLIRAILDACGVRQWEHLKGRTVFVLKEPGWSGMVRGIAPLPTEKGKRVVFAEVYDG